VPRYFCRGAHINHGAERCISVGGLRVDEAVSTEILRVAEPHAIEAAIHAAEQLAGQDAERREALRLELEQARYEARLAERRYDAMDPENRLVAAELEARWNASLQRVGELETALIVTGPSPTPVSVDRAQLLQLAQELPRIWHAPETDKRLKQRIARVLLREVTLDVHEQQSEITVTLHWAGGRHSQVRVPKNKTGRHRHTTSTDAIEVIRSMAGRFPDDLIAATLNRLRVTTGHGHSWTESRLRTFRHDHDLPKYDPNRRDRSTLTLQEAALRLQISHTAVRHMIEDGLLTATQVVTGAPWLITLEALNDPQVTAAVRTIKSGKRRPRTQSENQGNLDFTGM
jgi:excisionase family DNA binding protein